jgi:chromosome segregation ATPase
MGASGKRPLFKMVGITLGALLVLPLSITAATSSNLTVEEGAKLIMGRELNKPILSGDPLSQEAQMYNSQSVITDELKKISEAQSDYQDRQSTLGFELSTYEQLYQYWYLKQAQEVNEKSVALSKEQLRLAQARYEQGVISEGQLLQVEMSLNEALVAKEEMDRNVDQLRYRLNQSLGRDVDQELEIELDKFKTIERSKLDKEEITGEVIKNHASLKPLIQTIASYQDALDEVDELEVNQAYRDAVKQAEAAVQKAQADVLEAKSKLCNPPEDQKEGCDEALKKYNEALAVLEQAKEALTQAQNQLADAEDDLEEAKDELEDYYSKQITDAEKRLEQQKQHLEWIVHTSIDELRQLEKAIDRYEENVELAEKLYEQAKARFEAGLATPSQLDEARLVLQNAELTLAGTKQKYLAAKERYLLFLEGYLPSGTSGMSAGM